MKQELKTPMPPISPRPASINTYVLHNADENVIANILKCLMPKSDKIKIRFEKTKFGSGHSLFIEDNTDENKKLVAKYHKDLEKYKAALEQYRIGMIIYLDELANG